MAETNDNTVEIKVYKVKDQPFFVVIGPGHTVLSANPMFDPNTGEKGMTRDEVYKEYERILMLDEHIKNPDHYELLNTYKGPANMPMYAEIDMRSKTLDEMIQRIKDSTAV